MKRMLEDYSQEISALDDRNRNEYFKREQSDQLIKELTGELISVQTMNATFEGKLAVLSEKAETAERELSRKASENKALESSVHRLKVITIYFEFCTIEYQYLAKTINKSINQ